ncbi:MAG: hypothetical protein Q4D91_09380 [Lautropia sp.]|nr:hypothetical protein [Lautropia sp.]
MTPLFVPEKIPLGALIMTPDVARAWPIQLIDQDLAENSPALSPERLASLRQVLAAGDALGEQDARDLANDVVGIRIGEHDGHEFEALIDWLMAFAYPR